ncbi:21 kDa subunit of NADH dehydrogenase [Acaromyces ingoldii]|uniref:21 kDa subunit of NADH dehydrogenase n=1 Tax=Acaromyces ingoldii TaxID=215250 RepID=A0A316YHE5_9BASI|nr:21 kDa subunit of NADH dehydrogenase [Acaromyces ingoldii]PWN88496.1 21 kDa subunit of NADH dehydrogenase [Acaromyces ingoldii]
MAMRASRTLLNEVKYASPHKYTYVEGRTPFWRKFREIFSVNPGISSGLPDPTKNRNPTPGSRPEQASTTPSRASDVAGNLYYNRDFRRKYPQLEMVTQQQLTQLLLAQPNEDGTKTLAPPGEGEADGHMTALTRPADLNSPSAFTDVLAQVHSPQNAAASVHYTQSNLPPTPPFKGPQHILKKMPGAVPHDPNAYYPAENYA